MKKLTLAIVCCGLMTIVHAQAVFTYGKKTVSKEEFLRAFNKNPVSTTDRKKALREYLDLYINFKLKVQAAYDAGLDKDPTQEYELQNFRRQIAENIINENANIKELVKEAFERSQKDIHLAHVFIEVAPKSDTTAAYKKIQEAYKALQQGADFGDVAASFSSDAGTIQSKGDLGYITAFTLPYEFENIAYRLRENKFAAPVRTSLGYHIFKNVAERSPLGTRRVAQILIAFPPNGSENEKKAAQEKADSVYKLLQAGTRFEDLVTVVSNDMSTNSSGGQLPEFGIGTYNPLFEQQAFALQNKGDVSQPFATTYGYHILKLLEVKPVVTDMKDDVYMASLQEKVTKDGRLVQAKKALVEKHLGTLKYKRAGYNEKDLFTYIDSNWQKSTASPWKAINDNTPIFYFASAGIKAADFLQFVRAVKTTPNEFSGKNYKELLQDYVRVTADEYYRNNLEKYSAEFDRQVKEFKEANLLFGVMDKNIWSKASEDTVGLLKHYNQHQNMYKWGASADALIINCTNESKAKELAQKLASDAGNWRTITDSYGSLVSADSGRYELGQLPMADANNFTPGNITKAVLNTLDGSATFNYIIKLYPANDQRSFEDARGMVISDYQQVLEDRWLADLKKKYPVKINEAVFSTLK